MSENVSATNAATDQLPADLISHDVSSFDSGLVFAVKALFYPMSAVAFLSLCLWFGGRSLNGTYFLIAVLSFAGVAEFLGESHIDHGESVPRQLRSLLDMQLRWLGIGVCVSLVLYLSGLQAILSDRVLLVWFVLTPVVLWTGNIGIRLLLLRVGVQYMETRNAVVIGVTEQGILLSEALQQQPLLRVNLHGFFEDREPGRLPPHAPRPLGRINDAATYVRQHDIHFVYITLPMSRHPRILELLDALRDTVASVYFVPDLRTLNHIQARLDVMHGIPMIAVCESPFFGVRSLTKRISDMVISGLILIGILPLLVIVAVGVKLTSPGPVIFKQRRYGLDGREIMVYKFRSMIVTEDGVRFTAVSRDDPRVTRFGAFIRKTSLDELPQFFNVIEGTMSIVGPRPHAVAMNEQYRQLIPSYMIRHKVKPGITGWAQVNGYRGGDDLESMKKRIEFDIEYLRHWSLWLDLLIVLRTVKLVVADARAY